MIEPKPAVPQQQAEQPPLDPDFVLAANALAKVIKAGRKVAGWHLGFVRGTLSLARRAAPLVTYALLAAFLLGGTGGGCLPDFSKWKIIWPVNPVDPKPAPTGPVRVLITYDSKVGLTPAQQAAVDGADLRAYLNSHCPLGPDGKTHEFRVLPAGTDVSNESQFWKDAMARSKAQQPWLMVGNGKDGYDGPLPANADQILAIIQKYGGK